MSRQSVTAVCFATPQLELPGGIVQLAYETATVWSRSRPLARGAESTLLLGKGESLNLLGPARLRVPSPRTGALE